MSQADTPTPAIRPATPPPAAHVEHGSIAATLRALLPGARPSEVWRAAAFALLRLNPRECEALALVFEEEAVSDELRTLVLDLLAGAGSFEAQVVLRRLLALAVARRSRRTFAMFVQRLGFVECPDGPTLRFLMSVYAESRAEPHDVRASCAYALGAAAGHASASGDLEAAIRATEVLRRDLLAAASVPEKCALVTALGNAGIPADVAVVTRFTADTEAPVRAAVALALRKMNVPEARVQLVALLADGEIVARSALAALSEHALDDDDLVRVAELVLGGRSAVALDGRLLRLLVAQRGRLTASADGAGVIEQALRLLLSRIEAAGSTEIAGSGERRAVSARASVRASESSFPPPPPPLSPTPPPPPLRAPVEIVRDRMIQLGLDPDAKLAEMPAPPPRRVSDRTRC